VIDYLNIIRRHIFIVNNATGICRHPQVKCLLSWTQLTELVPSSGCQNQIQQNILREL
jgi:hypothetical protein